MTPEQIGKAGELKLDELCNEVSLSCATLIPDLVGVDRYLEFSPPEILGFGSLDTRPAPLSCYAQVKSKGPHQRYWQLALSVAERIAKSTKPAFLILFEVGPDIKVTRGYLAHVRGNLLAKVLRRLRDAQRRGISDLNKRVINLSRKDGIEFQLEGEGFAEALRSAIGKSMAEYARAKNEELETLGFGEDRLIAKIKFNGADLGAIIDAHLGEGALAVDEISFSERRFNISLPSAPGILKSGVMTIEPHPLEGYELRIKNEATKQEVSLVCCVLYPLLPEVPRDALKFNIITDLIAFKFNNSGFTYTIKLNDEIARSFHVWRTNISAVMLLHAGKCEIILKRLEDAKEIRLGMTGEVPAGNTIEYNYFLKLLDAAIYLLEEAKVRDKLATLETLQVDARELRRAHLIMSQASILKPFRLTMKSPLPEGASSFELLFISAYPIGDDWFAYCARTTMHIGEKPTEWIGSPMVPVLTEALLGPVLQSYDSFRDRMIRITGVTTAYISPLLSMPDDQQVLDGPPRSNASAETVENK